MVTSDETSNIDIGNTTHEDATSVSDGEADDRVSVRIGGRDFYTTRSTLCSKSDLFKVAFSPDINPPNDGVFWMDRDPDAFSHILKYCRTNRFPLLRQNDTFDHAMYDCIRSEALFYGISELAEWISKAKYRYTMECNYTRIVQKLPSKSADAVAGILTEDALGICTGKPDHGDVQRVFSCFFRTVGTFYCCPRGVIGHDSPEKCGRRCRSARDEGYKMYKDVKANWLMHVLKTTIVRHDLLAAT